MGDTSETNTKVLSRELFLGVVALKRLYRKIIICAVRSLFPNPVTYIYVCGRKKNLNRTLEIDSPFQMLTVGLLVEFID